MRAVCTVISAAAILVLVGTASADVVYTESFSGFSIGNLSGQDGWTGGVDTVPIDSVSGNMQLVPLATGIMGHQNYLVHALGGSLSQLDSTKITTLEFTTQKGGNNSDFGFQSSNPGADQLFNVTSLTNGWRFDARGLVASPSATADLAGATSGLVQFKLVINGPALTAYGYYDLGSGYVEAGHWAMPDASYVEAVKGLGMMQDYRSGRCGIGLDNIVLSVSNIPEPTTSILLGLGIAGLLAYAWRKRK
jgi:hypothetical protein